MPQDESVLELIGAIYAQAAERLCSWDYPIIETSPPIPRSDRRPAVPVGSQKRIDRNSACPCGSGKKWKKCCTHKQLKDFA